MNCQYQNEGFGNKKAPVVYMFGRESKTSGRLLTKVKGVIPHFWGACEEDDPDMERDHFGRPVKYISTQIPTDVRDERRKYKYHCEADVLFNIRYLVDKEITCGYDIVRGKVVPVEDPEVPPLIFYFDIEVQSPVEIMPRVDDPRYPIVAISCSNNYDDNVIVWLLRIESLKTKYHKRLSWKDHNGRDRHKDIEVELRRFDTERDLLADFMEYLVDLDPDVLTGWNAYLFDFPYVHKRCDRLGVDIRRISPFDVVQITQAYGARKGLEYRIKGRDPLDLLVVYRRWRSNLGQLPSYDFKYVVELETGYEYTDYGDRIDDLVKGDHETLIDYCINDGFALKLLDEEKELIESYDRKRRISGVLISDALSNKKLIDTWLLRKRERPLPSASHHTAEGFKGAIVLDPTPGIHEQVAIFDLSSLYPNIIVGFNISPETVSNTGDILVVDPEDGRTIRFKSTPEGLLPQTVRTFLDEREYYRTYKRTIEGITKYIRESPRDIQWLVENLQIKTGTDDVVGVDRDTIYGILGVLVESEYAETDGRYYSTDKNYESALYTRINKREQDYKWLSVSAYGVFGYVNFRLFDENVARSITAIGRTLIKRLVEGSSREGYQILYGDTDSIFIQLHNSGPRETWELEDFLNGIMSDFAKERGAKYPPRIKFENRFTRFLMKKGSSGEGHVKKRYAGVLETGKLYIRGLEPRRSDTAQITRESIERWLEMILRENDLQKANNYLREVYNNLPELPANRVGIPKGIQKATTGPWVRGRDYATRVFGYKFRPDRKPILLYVKRTRGLPDTDSICITEEIINIPKGIEIDWEKMREKTLKMKFEGLLEAAGSSWEEIAHGIKQTTWGDWV